MEKIELFLYDIFGNFIPGSILNFIFFSDILKILRVGSYGEAIDSKLAIIVFFFSSYILGNLLNMISSRLFLKFKLLGVNNLLNGEAELVLLKEELKYEGRDIYDLAKKYIEKKGYPNFVKKFEAKYLLYRNLTLALFISYVYTTFINGKVDVLHKLFMRQTTLVAVAIIVTTFFQFRYYWKKTRIEMVETLLLIRKKV